MHDQPHDPFDRALSILWETVDRGLLLEEFSHYAQGVSETELPALRREYDFIQNSGSALASAAGSARGAGPDDEDLDPRSPTRGALVRPSETERLLERLSQSPRIDTTRFVDEGVIARGGMGAIHSILDQQLNRRLAMKRLIHGHSRNRTMLGRFLEEAQVTSQLEHPGVVPVHELALDQDGTVCFTMRLVRGRTAAEIFAESHAGSESWPLTRALEVVLKVCDTVAYAHSRGVLHRDLKPANIMVGHFGEVYVMDWGLAKLAGQHEAPDPDLRGADPAVEPDVHTARSRDTSAAHDTWLTSQPGQRLGTPHYMSPEQACGEPLDERTDVYSIGAMLYQLLTGIAPYTSSEGRGRPDLVLAAVASTAPKALAELARSAPPALIAITEKAMARAKESRYANPSALADDLRAFLALRTVKAFHSGAVAELRMWVVRNPPLAGSLLALILLLTAGIVVSQLYNQRLARTSAERLMDFAQAEGRRAAWDRQLSLLAAARATGHADEGSLLVAEAQAHLSRLDPSSAEASLRGWHALGRPAPGGVVALLEARLLLQKAAPRAEILARTAAARKLGLEPAEQHFASGLEAIDLSSAVESFSAAVALDPSMRDAHEYRVAATALAGDFDAALEAARQMLLLYPTDSSARLVVPILMAMRGDVEQARAAMETLTTTTDASMAGLARGFISIIDLSRSISVEFLVNAGGYIADKEMRAAAVAVETFEDLSIRSLARLGPGFLMPELGSISKEALAIVDIIVTENRNMQPLIKMAYSGLGIKRVPNRLEAIAFLREHPRAKRDALADFLLGMTLIAEASDREPGAILAAIRRAVPDFEKAARNPSLIPAAPRAARHFLMQSFDTLARIDKVVPPRAIEWLDESVNMEVGLTELYQQVRLASAIGRQDLGLVAVRRAKDRLPKKQHHDLLDLECQLLFDLGSFDVVRTLASQLPRKSAVRWHDKLAARQGTASRPATR